MTAVLELRGLDKSYGDTVALRDVSLEVRAGEVFGLLGPNGAGKTTLIRIVMDIIRADEGAITLFGAPFTRPALDRIGYLPEERGLYTKQTVIDVMTYFAMLRGMPRSEARSRSLEWLQRIGLPETARWKVERLSKGMSQKVQLAATLLHEPELCVLDEPFSGLDPMNVRLVRQFIDERRAAGRTTILSTHRMNMVEELCDRVGLIDRGRLLAYGGVEELRRQHSLPEVRIEAPGELPTLAGVQDVRAEKAGWVLLLSAGTRPTDVLGQLVRAGVDVHRFERVLASMEEVFIRVVEKAA